MLGSNESKWNKDFNVFERHLLSERDKDSGMSEKILDQENGGGDWKRVGHWPSSLGLECRNLDPKSLEAHRKLMNGKLDDG